MLREGVAYTIAKYGVVIIGLVRTIIIAALFTKHELGIVAAVLLILEYLHLLSPLGAMFGFNKSVVNLQAEKPGISIEANAIEELYRSTTYLIIIGLSLAMTFLFIISHSFEIFSSSFESQIYVIMIIIILGVYRSYGVIHNRLWGKYYRILASELVYALMYLAGVAIFLKSGEGFLTIYLYILIGSLIAGIFTANFVPSFKISFKSRKHLSDLTKLSLILLAFEFLETFFWGVDRVFITLFLLPSQLADFHIAHTWSKGVLMAYMALAFLFTSELMKQFTMTNDRERNERIQLQNKRLTKTSEILLALIVVAAVFVIPIAINLTMNKYNNIDDILVLILLGLMLKGMCFFPASFMIANHLQNRLVYLSISLTIMAAIIYYTLKDYISSPIEYLSISISLFMIYLIVLNIIKNKNFDDVKFKDFFYYKKMLIVIITMIYFVNSNFLSEYITTNLSLLILMLIIYNKSLWMAIINLIKFVIYRNKIYLEKILLDN